MTLNFAKKPFALAIASFLLSGAGSLALAASTTSSTTPTTESQIAPGEPNPHHSKGYGHHGGKGGHGHHCALMKQLNLTQDQKDKLKAVHTRFRQENKAALDSMRAKHEELKALGTDSANDAKRKALRKELREAHHSLAQKHHAMMDGILTPQQMEQMKAAKAKCRAEHPHNSGGKGPHHDSVKPDAAPAASAKP